MFIKLECACGLTLVMDEIEPATAELMIDTWHTHHPHAEELRETAVMLSFPQRLETDDREDVETEDE